MNNLNDLDFSKVDMSELDDAPKSVMIDLSKLEDEPEKIEPMELPKLEALDLNAKVQGIIRKISPIAFDRGVKQTKAIQGFLEDTKETLTKMPDPKLVIEAVPKAVAKGSIYTLSTLGTQAEWFGEMLANPSLNELNPNTPAEKMMANMDKVAGDYIAEYGRTAAEYWAKKAEGIKFSPELLEALSGDLKDEFWLKSIVLVSQAIPSFAMSWGVGITTGSTVAAITVLGGLEAAPVYKAARKAGKSVDKATLIGASVWVGVSILEYYPMNFILGGGTGKVMSTMLISGLAGGGEEALQGIWTNLIIKIGYDKTQELMEGIQENIIAGVGSQGLFGGFSTSRINRFTELKNEAGLTKTELGMLYEQITSLIIKKAPEIENQLKELQGLIPTLSIEEIEKLKLPKAEKEGKDMFFQQNLYPTDERTLGRIHEESVMRAIEEGESIPRKVLAEYPKIKKKVVKPVEKPAEVVKEVKEPVETFTQKLQKIEQEFKTVRARTKAEIKLVQTEIIKDLEQSKLEAVDKAKFIRAIKNVQTQQQLIKQLPIIQERVTILETKAQVRKIKAQIKRTIKATKPRKVAGKPKGRFTPEVQEVLDILRNTVKLGQDAAIERLNANLAKEGIPSPINALENKLLTVVSGQQTLSPVELQNLLDDISALKEGGAAIAKIEVVKKREQRKVEREESLKDIIGTKTPSTSRIKKVGDKLRKAFKSLSNTVLGWDNLMNLLAIDSRVAPGESSIEKITKVSHLETAEKRTVRIAIEDVTKKAMDSFGFTTEKQLINKFSEDTKIESLGIFKNARNEEVDFELSKSEARKLWMEMQDKTLRETFFTEKGNAYTASMIQAVYEFLSQEDRAFAMAQLDFYRDFYDQVNEVYSKVYGINLPFNEFYSPISREHKDVTISDEFLKEMNFRRSVTTGSLKSRIFNVRPIKPQSDITVLQKHIIEMSHFVVWSDKISQLNNIFTDNKIKDMIDKKFGSGMQKSININISNYTRGGIDNTQKFGMLDKIRVNFTRSVLAVKAALFAKQMVSFIAYADDVSTTDFIAGVLDFTAHPMRSTEILNKSELMKARGMNLTRDIKDAMKSEEWSAFKKNPNFLNSLMFMTKLGDRGAILLGGWSVYKSELKRTDNKEKAMALFEEKTSATQQSADLSQLSRWQTANSFQKMFTMFTSSQNQYYRKEYMAIRNLIAGKVSPVKAAKTILIYHFILPMLFQLVSDFGKWDKEEQLRAAVLGSANGIFIVNDILNNLVRIAIGLRTYEFSVAPFSIAKKITMAFKHLAVDDLTNEDVIEAMKDFGTTAGYLTALPIEQTNNWLEGIKNIQEGETGRGALKLLGWSPYVIKKQLGKERVKLPEALEKRREALIKRQKISTRKAFTKRGKALRERRKAFLKRRK